jgi:RNA 3'-terminal phosphate cyclase (ATP)
MIEISGDMLEGGGQIIRTTIALAALAGVDVKLTKIREKRPNPGLQPQHVTAVRALATISQAETEGLAQGSRELEFRPSAHGSGLFRLDVGTAGSIPLVLQALMPCLNYSSDRVELDLIGGTDVKWSPSIDYLNLIVLPALQRMGYQATIKVNRRGHYPRGGGQVTVTVKPSHSLNAITLLKRGELQKIEGISHCVKLPPHVAQRQADAAKKKLSTAGYHSADLEIETYPPEQDTHLGPGSGITLVAKFSDGSVLGADNIGERGKPAETVGQQAAERLLAEIGSNAPVDRHLGDILIPYMAVAKGRSEIQVSELTLHTITNITVTEKILGVKFQIQGEEHQPAKISVDGIDAKS